MFTVEGERGPSCGPRWWFRCAQSLGRPLLI